MSVVLQSRSIASVFLPSYFLSNYHSESLAMKHRLKSAVDRANKLENDLANANSTNDQGDVYDSMERAQISRRRRPGAASSGSIRSAMRLDSSGGERSEKIGQVVDAVDSFSVSTGMLFFLIVASNGQLWMISDCLFSFHRLSLSGKYLRRNPLARAGFISYLILIHLWSFVILFFHAHSFDEHGDFGAGVGVPHGPHAMMMQQKLVKPVTVNGNAAEAIPIPKEPVIAESDSGAKADSRPEGASETKAHAGGEAQQKDEKSDNDAE